MKSAHVTPASGNILNSWKEVAHYLERGVRTVQRWETELGLPVHRPRGKKRSAVMAVCSEIDQWIVACPVFIANENSSRAPQKWEAKLRAQCTLKPSVNETILQSRFLRSNVRRSRQELSKTIHRLVGTLAKTATQLDKASSLESQFLLPVNSRPAKRQFA